MNQPNKSTFYWSGVQAILALWQHISPAADSIINNLTRRLPSVINQLNPCFTT